MNNFIKQRLIESGFNDLVFYSFGIPSNSTSIADFSKLDFYYSNSNINQTLFDLFFFGRSVNLLSLQKIFLQGEINELVDRNIIKITKNDVIALMRVFFHNEYLFVSDFPFRYENGANIIQPNDKDITFIPHIDSYHFSKFITDKCNEVIDIGTGCGFLAIIVAKKSKNVIGVDINKRAIKIANLNKEINNIKNVEFIVGDLFEPVGDRKFNLIISNPPHGIDAGNIFKKPLAVDGGSDGLKIVRRIINQSRLHLNRGGVLEMLLAVGGNNEQEIKLNIIKLLGKHNKNIFIPFRTFTSFEYAWINFLDKLIIKGLRQVIKDINYYTQFLDSKNKIISAGLLVSKLDNNFSLKILESPLLESEINKKIADYFRKN